MGVVPFGVPSIIRHLFFGGTHKGTQILTSQQMQKRAVCPTVDGQTSALPIIRNILFRV